MEELLQKTIFVLEEICANEQVKKSDFDKKDVTDTFKESMMRAKKILHHLEKKKADDKENLNKNLIHLELEYCNFVWCFEEIRDLIKHLVVELPD